MVEKAEQHDESDEAVTPPETSPDEAAELPPEGGHQRDQDLAQVVSGLEQRVADERRDANVAGNADDRAMTESVESEDQAPE